MAGAATASAVRARVSAAADDIGDASDAQVALHADESDLPPPDRVGGLVSIRGCRTTLATAGATARLVTMVLPAQLRRMLPREVMVRGVLWRTLPLCPR
jgi:hypothetical protein